MTPRKKTESKNKVHENVDKYTYRIQWSEEDHEFVGLCAEFPLLSWLDSDQIKALKGIRDVVAEVVADKVRRGESIPEPIVVRKYSGVFKVRVPSEVHRRLVLEAAEANVSLNRLVSSKLSASSVSGVDVAPE